MKIKLNKTKGNENQIKKLKTQHSTAIEDSRYANHVYVLSSLRSLVGHYDDYDEIRCRVLAYRWLPHGTRFKKAVVANNVKCTNQ